MKPTRRRCSAVLLLLLPLLPLAAGAASTTTTFNVTATVIDVCAVSATNLGFGTYNPIGGAALDGTSTITVTCTLDTPYNVQIDQGANGGSVTTRQMIGAGNSDLLNYSLYRDSGRTLNWGETDNTDTVSATGSGLAQDHTVYGRIPASENVSADSYSDTVNVTVSY